MQEQTTELPQTNTPHAKRHSGIILGSALVVGLLVVGSVYAIQHMRLQKPEKNVSQLHSQVSTLTSNLAALRAKANVSTDGWKTYCDPVDLYCFKYPSDWKIDQSSEKASFGATISSATVTSPKDTVEVKYGNYDVRDAGLVSSHIVSVDNLSNTSLAAKVVGEYFITSVGYQPFFVAADANDTSSLAPGKLMLWTNNERIAGQDQLIASSTDKSLTTPSQASAWFNSVDAKTALAIMKSLSKN